MYYIMLCYVMLCYKNVLFLSLLKGLLSLIHVVMPPVDLITYHHI